MIIIVGLGNPGSQYAHTRHNVGFLALDHIASTFQANPYHQRFSSDIARVRIQDKECLLVKPLTFMNLSGRAVGDILTFYKVSAKYMVVVSDDIDQNFGMVRMRMGGGHGGHNGIRNILEFADTDGFRRIKIGVGKPPLKAMVPSYVLSPFSSTEMESLAIDVFPVVQERLLACIKDLSRES